MRNTMFLTMLKAFTNDNSKDTYFHDSLCILIVSAKLQVSLWLLLTPPTLCTASLNRRGFWSKHMDAQTETIFDLGTLLRTKGLYDSKKIVKVFC